MGAFFSSQDALMLQQEGNDTNCFVSLVVDTRGQYVARITRKVQSKSEVTVKNLGTSYEFFGEGPKSISEDGKQVSKVVDKETIEYFDLEVERHVVENSLDYLDARFEEIQSRKNRAKTTSFIGSNSIDNDFFKGFDRKENKELDLFKSPYDSFKESDLEWMPDPKKIHKAVVNMITCSFIVCVDKFDLKQWIVKHIDKVYKNIFGECEDIKENEAFTQWKEFVVQFTLDHFDYENVADDYNWEIYESKVAQAIIDELSKFSDNAYIKAYMEELYYYITD